MSVWGRLSHPIYSCFYQIDGLVFVKFAMFFSLSAQFYEFTKKGIAILFFFVYNDTVAVPKGHRK